MLKQVGVVALATLTLYVSTVPAMAQTTSHGRSFASCQMTQKKQSKSDRKHGSKTSMKTLPTSTGRKILIFPPDTKGGVTDQFTDVITDVEQSRLRLSGKYNGIYFVSSLPLVRRALNEQTLTPADVNPPYDNDAKAKRLATSAGYDLVLLTSIGDYQYDADKKQISLSLSARMIDFSGDKPVIRSVGDSIDKAAKDERDVDAASQAARELTEKLMAELMTPAKPATSTTGAMLTPGAQTVLKPGQAARR